MARPPKVDPTESGVLVYPKMPVPEGRKSEPRLPRRGGSNLATKTLAAIFAGGLVAGTVVGFILRPRLSPDHRVGKLEKSAEEAQRAAGVQKDRADKLEADLKKASDAASKVAAQLGAAKEAEKKLAAKAAEAEKKAKASDSAQAKLSSAVDKATGSVTAEGDEIRLQLVDKVLFKLGDDQLTERGKAVLAKVGAALKEIPDKQIWVQGHTDDTPIVNPPTPKKPKGAPPPAPRFATNWELSAARALTVVHYLQETAKLDPAKLAALAFGQYRPVSKANKAANRRIEIVLYPYHVVGK